MGIPFAYFEQAGVKIGGEGKKGDKGDGDEEVVAFGGKVLLTFASEFLGDFFTFDFDGYCGIDAQK